MIELTSDEMRRYIGLCTISTPRPPGPISVVPQKCDCKVTCDSPEGPFEVIPCEEHAYLLSSIPQEREVGRWRDEFFNELGHIRENVKVQTDGWGAKVNYTDHRGRPTVYNFNDIREHAAAATALNLLTDIEGRS